MEYWKEYGSEMIEIVKPDKDVNFEITGKGVVLTVTGEAGDPAEIELSAEEFREGAEWVLKKLKEQG